MAASLSLMAPAKLASQRLEGFHELEWQASTRPQTAMSVSLLPIQSITEKSPGRATALSAAGTLVPIAAGAVVLATRPRGGPEGPADETYDAVGGALIGVGLGLGPSLGHFYAHQTGWFVPRVIVGGVLGLVAASSDLDAGAPLALLGLTAVTFMAARDIATASRATERYNARAAGPALD